MLCVIAKIDETATGKLMQLQDTVREFGMTPKGLHGHITLISYTGNHEKQFIQTCKIALRDQESFPVCYEKIEVLSRTSIIVASPEKTGWLTDVHDRLAEGQYEYLDEWSQRAVWQPHTTLVYHPERDLEVIARRMQADFVPFSTWIRRIEFSRVTETGYEIADWLELSPGATDRWDCGADII